MKKQYILSGMMKTGYLSTLLFASSACKQDYQELSNQKVRVKTPSVDGSLLQEFYAAGENGWELIVNTKNNSKYAQMPLYDADYNKGSRYLMSNIKVRSIKKRDKRIIGELNDAVINISISLGEGDEHFHIAVESNFSDRNAKVEYVLSDFLFHSNASRPEFVHTPALKFQEEDIIGDRAFWTPAIIMQQGSNFVALVPDQVATSGARPVATGDNFSVPIDSGKIT